jgi:hypothetical protein
MQVTKPPSGGFFYLIAKASESAADARAITSLAYRANARTSALQKGEAEAPRCDHLSYDDWFCAMLIGLAVAF